MPLRHLAVLTSVLPVQQAWGPIGGLLPAKPCPTGIFLIFPLILLWEFTYCDFFGELLGQGCAGCMRQFFNPIAVTASTLDPSTIVSEPQFQISSKTTNSLRTPQKTKPILPYKGKIGIIDFYF